MSNHLANLLCSYIFGFLFRSWKKREGYRLAEVLLKLINKYLPSLV